MILKSKRPETLILLLVFSVQFSRFTPFIIKLKKQYSSNHPTLSIIKADKKKDTKEKGYVGLNVSDISLAQSCRFVVSCSLVISSACDTVDLMHH